jgi:TonB family protein
MHREGRAQVAFAYVDGAVENISLIRSSRSGLLDQAALAAVRRAAYPHPPTALQGVRFALDVWVNFNLQAE